MFCTYIHRDIERVHIIEKVSERDRYINKRLMSSRFLGESEVPHNTSVWLHENSKASLDIAFKWTTLLDRSAWDAIRYDPMCRDLYDLMRDYWTADYAGRGGNDS
jgi:hypothetical protein